MRARFLIIIAAMLAAAAARAEVSASVGVYTDYDFRGISQTEGDPAIQASFDYAGDLFYASLWGSNVDFGDSTDGNMEVDLIFGWATEYENGLRWDLGAVWYLYPGSREDLGDPGPDDDIVESADYWEIAASGGYGPVDVKYWYSPDLYDSNETASYLEANAAFDLPLWELGLGLHAGYSFGDYYDAILDDYIDYSIALTRSFGNFDFELKYVATDTDSDFEVDTGAFRNDERVIFSVSTTLPWSSGEE